MQGVKTVMAGSFLGMDELLCGEEDLWLAATVGFAFAHTMGLWPTTMLTLIQTHIVKQRSRNRGVNINKTDLINALAEKKSYKKYAIKNAIDDIFEEIAEALVRGDKVSIRGFGTFEPKMFQSHPADSPWNWRTHYGGKL